ncbi:sulfite exporter TauE/SafE family protein [Synechococcus sp. RSCCF101]|uniref:sulfite exporter TauE/SafE family protein n=1 Tax=Synechococcus sp. RSCCF101 TaxID=2511069 RepID=UPI001CD931CE|nr:sulfite exporter TauE/SafE family protein [Synechococcus sp. RSCCF101]
MADLLPLLPLGIMAGLLSGLVGIGGGLVFSPLLLALGLDPHQALATSTMAIVPTTLGGTTAHLRSRSLPLKGSIGIGAAALLAALLFSRMGRLMEGWHLLSLQALMYVLLALSIRSADGERGEIPGPGMAQPILGLAGVGAVAGFAGGLLGLGGGLVMVPLMVRGLTLPIHLAIRFSTLAVACSASGASLQFLSQGRGLPATALILGGTAALAAQWSASRMDRVSGPRLAGILRGLAVLLALDSGRRALSLLLSGA